MKTIYNIALAATGMTTEEAATLHDVAQITVKKWSAGDNTPGADRVAQLLTYAAKQDAIVDRVADQVWIKHAQGKQPTVEDLYRGIGTLDGFTPGVKDLIARKVLDKCRPIFGGEG